MLCIISVLGTPGEDVKKESPAQARDISQGLGTWRSGQQPFSVSWGPFPSFSNVDEEKPSGVVDGKGSEPPTSAALVDVVLPDWH